MKTLKNIIILLLVALVLWSGFRYGYCYIHSTPERLIRSDLFSRGHFMTAFTTDVYLIGIDIQYGQFYGCKNPTIGPDHYSFIKKNGLWYINWKGTGGG